MSTLPWLIVAAFLAAGAVVGTLHSLDPLIRRWRDRRLTVARKGVDQDDG